MDSLDPLCLQVIASALGKGRKGALDLARCSQTCRDFRQVCTVEVELRARALVRRCWPALEDMNGDAVIAAPFQNAEDMSPADADAALWPPDVHVPQTTDAISLIASYAGGWGALLAGRQGLLDTQLPRRDHNLVPHYTDPEEVTTWIIWDVRDACGQSRWCGVKPLADELDASEDNMGQPTCQIHPCSRRLPGGPCVWKHSFNDGIRQSVHFASGRTSGWEVSMSVIGPEFYETEISAFRFFPGDLLESIGLATLTGSNLWGETEAEGSDGAPVPGVKRYRAEGYVLHRPEEGEDEDLDDFDDDEQDGYLSWDVTAWVDRRPPPAADDKAEGEDPPLPLPPQVLADVELSAPDWVWPRIFARAGARRGPEIALEPRPAGGWVRG